MFGLDGSHAIVGGLVAIITVLAKALLELIVAFVRKRNGAPSPDAEAAAFRALMTEKVDRLSAMLVQTHSDISDLLNLLHPLVTRVAVLEREVDFLRHDGRVPPPRRGAGAA